MNTSDFVFALSGTGPRRWQALDTWPEEAAGVATGLGLPAAAVRERLTCRLPIGPDAAAAARKVLDRIDTWLAQGLGVAGYLGYELGCALEDLPAAAQGPDALPDADLVAFDPGALVALERRPAPALRPPPAALPAGLSAQGPAYRAAVRAALEAIGAGEIYQVNLTVATRVPCVGGLDVPLARALAAIQAVQPVPYGFAWRGEGFALLSGSMERFLTVRGAAVSSRPIKGTAPRARAPRPDLARARALRASPKERAENTMIVDMMRNDLRRACRPGTIAVTALLEPTPYATLWHLESEVVGVCAHPGAVADLLAATLPPASVSGCPKIQACKVISRLERRRRGPYCGTVGLCLPDGRADWSVGIRQLVVFPDRAEVSVGAGIVADSRPAAEWRETCLKARSALALLAALEDLARLEAGARGAGGR